MTKGRLEAFTDGVVAIIITIMVLEIKVPKGDDFEALKAGLPIFLAYALSYVDVGIFWNNHHHMLHARTRVPRCSECGYTRAQARRLASTSIGASIDLA